MRAETFFNFATYLEEVGSPFLAYGGRSLHSPSHGEAFLALFENRFEDGLFEQRAFEAGDEEDA